MYVIFCFMVCFFKKKTAYEMRISDWSSDVCSSDLQPKPAPDDIGESVDVRLLHKRQIEVEIIGEKAHGHTEDIPEVPHPALQIAIGEHMRRAKHGRATRTDRVCQYVKILVVPQCVQTNIIQKRTDR